jgi:hypothetical protein
MRIRNFYGPITSGSPSGKTQRSSGPRRAVTSRGRAVLAASRRRSQRPSS